MKPFNFLFIALIFFFSCNEESIKPEPQFQIFADQTLKYEYYYDYEGWGQWPVNVLQLQVIEGLRFNNKLYNGFSNSDDSKPDFDLSNGDDVLDFNFLPIRYENGKYFELRGSKELIILKDNLRKDDTWEHNFRTDDEEIITYTFEVLEKHQVYKANKDEYQNVFQIKETFHTNNPGSNGDQISMHFYNRQMGIIRREIPVYVSGTYAPIVFNRIK